VSAALHVQQQHDRNHVADMQGPAGRVEADITGNHARFHLLLKPGGNVVDHATPAELVNKNH
jgi:hypothetical protein